MRSRATTTVSAAKLAIAVALGFVSASHVTRVTPVLAAPDAAQAIAQKFSVESEPKNAPESQSTDSRSPSTGAPAAKSPAKKPAAAPVAATPATGTPPSASENPDTRPVVRPDIDYEMDMLRRARLEDAERKAATRPESPPAPAASSTAVGTPTAPVQHAQAPEPAATAVTPQKIVPAVAPPAAPTPAATATPQAIEQAKAPSTPAATMPAPPTSTVAAKRPAGATATVLLALDAPSGAATGGKVTPDAVICIAEQCYLSGGFGKPAIALPRTEAMALKGTAEKSPETCRGKFGCVYRNVDIPDGAQITVVDLGSNSGSAAAVGSFTVEPDKTCKVEDGDLYCENGLVTHAYRVWIIPEATAAAAGIPALDDALADGLMTDDVAGANDK